MRKRIVAFRRLNEEQLAQLREHHDVDYFEHHEDADSPAFHAALSRAHGLITAGLKVTPKLIDSAPHLETIASISVGYDNYPLATLTERNILLCNTPDVLTETTADTGFLLIMATARRAVELANWVKDGHWKSSIGPDLFGSDVHGKTLGMVGFGRIGAAIARRGALGFGMQIRYTMASPKPELEKELGALRLNLQELLATSDFVCVSVPLNADTEKLIDSAALKRMKPNGILINISRGKVIDEQALIEALNTGQIGAAGLDVFEQEPLPVESPLPHMPNVVALPHIGSATHETRASMAQRAVDNMLLSLAGNDPISPVNSEVLTRRSSV